MKARTTILKLHRAIGIVVGLLLVVITLSGSLLVFATEIDAWLSPQIFRVTPQTERVSLDSVLQTVQAAHPNHNFVDILLPKTLHGVYRIMADGAPLAKQLVGVIYPLHVGVVGGMAVKYLYVLLGLTPLALFVTGFALWWSRTYGLKLTSRS